MWSDHAHGCGQCGQITHMHVVKSDQITHAAVARPRTHLTNRARDLTTLATPTAAKSRTPLLSKLPDHAHSCGKRSDHAHGCCRGCQITRLAVAGVVRCTWLWSGWSDHTVSCGPVCQITHVAVVKVVRSRTWLWSMLSDHALGCGQGVVRVARPRTWLWLEWPSLVSV